MKNKVFLFIFISLIYMFFSNQTVEAETATVTIPEFPVTINGEIFDSYYNEYPLIVYKDITYFPMTYENSRFLGLKANWYDSTKTLFIGVAEESSQELKTYKRTEKNLSSYQATIPNYKIALNAIFQADFIDNMQEEFPILNFRNVTYFPLTWRFAVEEFGWTYSWDNEKGLTITCLEPFRPILNDRNVGNTSPNRGLNLKRYFYTKEYYVGYPSNTFEFNYDLIIKKRGEEEKVFSLESYSDDGDYYFYEEMTELFPAIENNIFSVICERSNHNGRVSMLLKINLETGEVIYKEIIE